MEQGKEQMGMLTREKILETKVPKMEKVDVPEWGGYLFVKIWKASERDKWEYETYVKGRAGKKKEQIQAEGFDNIRAKLVAATACDDKGNLLFTPSDVKILGEKSAKALDRVFSKAQEVNGLRNEDLELGVKN